MSETAVPGEGEREGNLSSRGRAGWRGYISHMDLADRLVPHFCTSGARKGSGREGKDGEWRPLSPAFIKS